MAPDAVLGPDLHPLIHVEALAPCMAFYEALGAKVECGDRNGLGVALNLHGARFALLAHAPCPAQRGGLLELEFQTGQPLEWVARVMQQSGMDIVQPPSPTVFGRQLQVAAADGLLMKINEIDWTVSAPNVG